LVSLEPTAAGRAAIAELGIALLATGAILSAAVAAGHAVR